MPTVEQGASKMSAQHRSLDAAGLRRMQELDKSFFGGAAGRNRPSAVILPADDSASAQSASAQRAAPWATNGHLGGAGAATGQLPPLISALPDSAPAAADLTPAGGLQPGGGSMGGGVNGAAPSGSKTLGYTLSLAPVSSGPPVYGSSVRPRTVGSSSGQRRAANAKPPRRGAGAPALDPITSTASFMSASSLNPWEALLDAAPAMRYGSSLARDGGGLQLLMPSGSSRQSMASYEHRLLSYLQPVSGPSGTASVVGNGGVAAAAGTSPLHMSVGSPPRSTAATVSGGYGPPTVISVEPLPLPVTPNTAGAASLWAPAAPWTPTAATHGSSNSSLPPLIPRSSLNAALSVPPLGAEQPWGGAGLPYGMYSALAEMRGGVTAGVAATSRDSVPHGGMNAVTTLGAAGGSGGGGADAAAEDLTASPPTLTQMMTVRPSNRRQVQLMADWLDNTIGSMWEQYGAAAANAASAAGGGGGSAAIAGSGTSVLTGSGSVTDVHSLYSSGPAASGGGSAAAGARRATSATSPPGGKAALAARFGNVAAGLNDLSSSLYHVATDSQLWSSMVEATAAVANAVVQNVAHRCFEEGALLARLWNLHTALMDSGLAAARRAREQLSVTTAEQAAKIRRLDPLIDWELESRTAREELSTALEASRAEALLAGRERDALLRENDKIIAHYRQELKTYRREQRRNAYRLARKLRNTQQQLELMTRDRDVLYNAVAYTKGQTSQLVDLIGGLQGHLKAAMAGALAGGGGGGGRAVSFDLAGEDAFPELTQIEQGLKNILHSVTKVRDVNQDAEDSHFVMEEQVTAVAAADTTGDELVDEVLAEGDPEPSPEELAAEAAAAAAAEQQRERQLQQQQGSDSDADSDASDPRSALSKMAEAALRGSGESSEEGEDDGRPVSGSGNGNGAATADGAARDGGGGGMSYDEDEDGFGGGLYGEISQASGREGYGNVGEDSYLEDPDAEEEAIEEEVLRRQQPQSRSPIPRSSHSPAPAGGSGDDETAAAARHSGGSRPLSRLASRSSSPDVGLPPRSTGAATTAAPSGGGSGPAGSAQQQQDKKKNKNKSKAKSGGNGSGGGGGGAERGSSRGGGDGAATTDGRTPTGVTAGSGSRSTPAGSIGQVGSTTISSYRGSQVLQDGGGGSGGRGGGGDGPRGSTSSTAAAQPPPRRVFHVSTSGCQTGPELLRGVADPDIAEAARQMRALRGALGEIGIMGNPNDDADGTDGLLTALRQYMASLSQEAGTLSKQLEKLKSTAESAEAARADLAQTAEARGREVAAVRRELLESKKRYSSLCNALEALGIDPRNPSLPSLGEGDSPRGLGTGDGSRPPGSRGSVKGRESLTDVKGGKVSRLAAVKEKARVRAMAATVPHAPALGPKAPSGPRGGGNTGFAAPSNRVTLPAAMLAAAQQRAAEAAGGADGDGGGSAAGGAGGVGVAASINAWRAGGAGGGAAGGPTPVYIRPDRAAATARLQDALTRYADAKPRTLEWLLKLIESMYRGKATSDEQRAKIGQEPLTLIEYMFQHLSGQYGTKDLVNQYAAQLVATCLQYCATDPRVGTFQRFLMEEWDTRVLCAYMDATRKLQEPSRVPCCDFPADYLTPGGRKGDSAPVDVRKALWVAERILMRRSPKSAYVFAQLLNSRADPITASELDSFFTSPGSYGAELQQVRQFESGRGEFKRLSSAVFLDALCGEFARMEGVFREVLPEIFLQYDSDADGWVTKQDITELFADMVGDMAHAGMQMPPIESSTTAAAAGAAAGGGGGGATGAAAGGVAAAGLSDTEHEAALEALWNVLATAEADARNRADSSLVYPDGGVRGPGGAAVSPAAVTHLSDGGFYEGAFRSDFVRGWVRAFKTSAAQLPGGVGALAEMDQHAAREAARRLLSVLVTRHWTHHGETLEGFFGETGPLAEQQLRQQAALVDGDMGGPHGDGRDGPRRAAALCTLLRLLLVKKADRFSQLLTNDHLTGGPNNGPPVELEDLLERLTAAVRLLYGPPDSIWVVGTEVDELESLSGLDAADVGALPAGYKRWLTRVAVRCCAIHDRLHLALPPSPLIPHLQTHRGVPFFARAWRRAAAAAVAARRRAAIARTPPFAAMRHLSGTGTGSGGGAVGSGGAAGGSAVAAAAAAGGGGGGAAVAATAASPVVKVLSFSGASTKRPGSGTHTGGTGRPGSPGRPGSGTARGASKSPTPGSRPMSGARHLQRASSQHARVTGPAEAAAAVPAPPSSSFMPAPLATPDPADAPAAAPADAPAAAPAAARAPAAAPAPAPAAAPARGV